MPNLNDIPSGIGILGAQSTSRALSTSTAAVGELSGSGLVIMFNTGATPGTYTTRSVAQMIADSNLQVGQTWLLFLANNQGTGTLTLAGGTGVTVSGTATCGTNVGRFFICTLTSLTTITMVGAALSVTTAA